MEVLKINVDLGAYIKIFYFNSLPLFYRDSFLIIINLPIEN